MTPQQKTARRIPNKSGWAFDDIVDYSDLIAEILECGLEKASKNYDVEMVSYLAAIAKYNQAIHASAVTARAGGYRERIEPSILLKELRKLLEGMDKL
jgi:hypothetical protein